MRIALLGVGEAGYAYARGLSEFGHTVIAYDLQPLPVPDGVLRAASAATAARNADIVLSFVGAAAAARVAAELIPELGAGTIYADMNTASPGQKREIAAVAAGSGVPFVDVAIMAPVPRAGSRTPLLVSGSGADRFASLLAAVGMPIDNVGPDAGTAAGLKLLRSVFMKGLAALILESLTAGEEAGAGQWVRAQIAGELGPSGDELVERLLVGTRAHAARREHEMVDARSYVDSLGTPSWMTQGAVEWLHRIASADHQVPTA